MKTDGHTIPEIPPSVSGRLVQSEDALSGATTFATVLNLAVTELLIVDPFMDEETINECALAVRPRVNIQLLADAGYISRMLKPAIKAWQGQHGASRPMSAYLAPVRTLLDRIVIVDNGYVFQIAQSVSEFTSHAPASVIRVDPNTAAIKLDHYANILGSAAPVL